MDVTLHLAQQPEADELLGRSPNPPKDPRV